MVDVGLRSLVVLAAGTATYLALPAWVSAPLSVASVLLVLDWTVRLRRRGSLDAAAVGLAALIIGGVLLGLVLNLLPVGVTRLTWSVFATLVQLNALFLALRPSMPPSLLTQWRSRRPPTTRSTPGRAANLACLAVAGALVVVSFVVAVVSARSTEVPPLQASVRTVDGNIELTVDSGAAMGPLDVALADGTSRTVVLTGLTLDAGAPVVVVLPHPAAPRVLVELAEPGSTTPLRTLIIDGTIDPLGRAQ